jgi:hypothetical protein
MKSITDSSSSKIKMGGLTVVVEPFPRLEKPLGKHRVRFVTLLFRKKYEKALSYSKFISKGIHHH